MKSVRKGKKTTDDELFFITIDPTRIEQKNTESFASENRFLTGYRYSTPATTTVRDAFASLSDVSMLR